MDVSIRAPAWGAISPILSAMLTRRSFNPRARVGRDSAALLSGWRRSWSFNPRARVGRDAAGQSGRAVLGEFQSARPRGARFEGDSDLKASLKFQSARPRGARW